MTIAKMNEMLKVVNRELDDLTVMCIESMDMSPLDIPELMKIGRVIPVLERFGVKPTPKMVDDAMNYYYADQILNSLTGGM